MSKISPQLLVKACAVLAVAAMATGCATTTTPTAHSGIAASNVSGQVDGDKMARVETVARRTGVTVVWVNPPRKYD
ncbi:MAG TPA: hypothetical protein PKZ76_00625 [Xanthomonadaceae bacterium]|nr:hypothetical protein [Xanthomonadaceae bacterium]